MISWMLTEILRINTSTEITENGIKLRSLIAIAAFVTFILLFVFVLRYQKKKPIRKRIVYVVFVILILEAVELLPYLQGVRHIPLEYVCSVETTNTVPYDADCPIWYTSCSIHSTPTPKEELEEYLGCSLKNVNIDGDYTYLFVYYYKDVDLIYSNWSKNTDNLIPPTAFYWIGKLNVQGKCSDKTIYVFRFPNKKIFPHDPLV